MDKLHELLPPEGAGARQVVVAGGFGSGVIAAGLAGMRMILDGPGQPVGWVLAGVSLSLVVIATWAKRQGPLSFLGPAVPGVAVVGISAMALAEAGLYSEALFWAPFLPMIAAFTCPPKWIWRFAALVVGMSGLLMAAHLFGWANVPLEKPEVAALRSGGLVGAAVFAASIAQLHANRAQEVERQRGLAREWAERARMARMLEALPIGVVIRSPSGEKVYVNQAAEQLADPDALGGALDVLLARSGSVRAPGEPCQQLSWERGGTRRLIEVCTSSLSGVDSQAGFRLSTLEDVSDRRRMELRLRQRARVEAIGRLAGGVAHDFNNLLTVIITNAVMGRDDAPRGSSAHRDFAEVLKAAQLGAGLVERLLAFSRRSEGETELLRVDDRCRSALALIEPLVGVQVHVDVQLNDGGWMVRMHAGALETTLMNLATNARDAMGPSGGTLSIQTEACGPGHPRAPRDLPGGEYVLLSVGDEGVGMTPAQQAQALEPFYTTKELGSGTGLGLATCLEAVSRIGGTMSFESRPGGGTLVRAYLPRDPGDTTPATVPQAPRPAAPPLAEGSQQILVVDDNPHLVRSVVRVLRREGYGVVSAGSAEEALQSFDATAPPALLLTDVMMPGMSGPELVARLREALPALPVLLMSGFADRETLSQSGVGSLPLVAKPFTPEDLLGAVKGVLSTAAGPA